VSGYTITARGYITTAHGHTARFVLQNDGSDETGLGLVNTLHNELQVDGNGTRFNSSARSDLHSGGRIHKMVKSRSQPPTNDRSSFGSNTVGSLHSTHARLRQRFRSSVCLQFQISDLQVCLIVAAALTACGGVSGATVVPIPEARSLIPVICLVIAATALEARRRRRVTA